MQKTNDDAHFHSSDLSKEHPPLISQTQESTSMMDSLKALWIERRFIATFILIGLIVGSVAALSLPKKYSLGFEIKRTSFENYDPVISVILSKDSLKVEENRGNFIYSSLSQAIYDNSIYGNVLNKIFVRDISRYYFENRSKVVSFKSLSPVRGAESSFIAGFSVNATFSSDEDVQKFVLAYSEEIKKTTDNLIIQDLKYAIKNRIDMNKLNIDVARRQFQLDSEILSQSLKDAISISKIGGIAKPLVPAELPVSAQIPLSSAVPKYFFGYEILQQEKQVADANAKNEFLIPGYAEMIATNDRLNALSQLLGRPEVRFLDVHIFPEVEKLNGWIKRAAILAATILFFLFMAVAWILARRAFRDSGSTDLAG
jgi:hypothetical protein